ncbi:cytochrome c-type biogenesis protein [Gluconacetobacter tumulisoli]|uniref:Cytochrome c-type biogenesis protein n=1 Tax=Gluconacetobacter tumulisoli TaxID=1286189 RepID=A0A7W4K4C7_9PROT|nr:cytochrome c-type biogenesis protein [Gluconacetobacter tumulisoli]MBB2200161.1 cytochrome c-type biogenesis protein CcmH [Gluconacetobacter tumulisoli]
MTPPAARRSVLTRLLFVLAVLAGLSPLAAAAVDDPAEMLPDPRQEARAEAIGAQLRCLVCQNESIEDSGADLARDLRHVVREHVAKGESDRQIMDWMVGRYGNFIRLRPPLTAGTLLLWIMPVLALLVGAGAAFLSFRRSRPATPVPLTDAERARLSDLTRPR